MGKEYAQEIANSLLLEDQSFSCHETIEYGDDGEFVRSPEESHCAGALIFLEIQNKPNQIMRIAERLGLYDRTKLDMGARVFRSAKAMVRRHT